MGLKFAVIPWNDAGLQDRIFITNESKMNVDVRNNAFLDMKCTFEEKGDSFHTIDIYSTLEEIDFFCFFELDWKWLDKIISAGFAHKMVYCNSEPPVVNPRNCPVGYEFIERFFPYILTWNNDWIDGITVFKRNIPYTFVENYGDVNFSERKLLTCISGNKKSKHPDEMYSERERVITFLENKYPNDFDFYGTGWKKSIHPSYCGRVEKKAETYHKYKFAICFENMKNIKGYVTEKILDCLVAGIVPVYAGAEDIKEYVPEECFINYWNFPDEESMVNFLMSMEEKEYQKYLDAGKAFIHSNMVEEFSGQRYAEYIYDVFKNKKNFQVSLCNRLYVKGVLWKQNIIRSLKTVIKRK